MHNGFLIWACMSAWAFVWLPVAYFERVLLPSQMIQKYMVPKVIPAIVDFFVWADIFWLPILLGYIVSKESDGWSRNQLLVWGLVGFVLTILFDYGVVQKGDWPATLGWKGGRTIVGWLHIPYMTVALAILGLHFFGGNHSALVLLVVAAGLMVQLPLDLHVPMWVIQEKYHFRWYPEVLIEDPRQMSMLIGGFTLVWVLTLYKLIF